MENPNTWNEIQKAIWEAIQEHHQQMGAGEFGFSDVTVIYNKLKEKGYLNILLPCVTPIEPSQAYLDMTPTCNRHDDCDAADQAVKDRNVRGEWGQTRVRADHCYSDDCEDCFGQ